MKLTAFLIPVLILTFMGFMGCSPADSPGPEPELEYMVFDIDLSLLGDPEIIPDTGVRYRPPLNWIPVPADTIQTDAPGLEKLIGTPTDLRIIAGYIDPSTGTFLAVTRLTREPDQEYLNRLQSLYAGDSAAGAEAPAEISQTRFITDRFTVHQFLVQTHESVIFRFMLLSGDPPEVEAVFIMPRDGYTQVIRTVESVVGSFTQNGKSGP
jgi:hypothetical protein